MKKQTFIAYIRDNDGRAITFERFSCKRAETVKKNMLQLLNNSLYRACIGTAARVDVYKTENTIVKGQAPTMIIDIK